MASVAAAIEEAHMGKADAELWWDSHALLFQALDKSIAGNAALPPENEGQSAFERESQQESEKDAALAENFLVNHQWLLKTLTKFKPPSSTSRAALNSSRVAVGNHVLDITSESKDLALQVSTLLVLDEIQSYILTSRVCEPKPFLSSLADNNALLSAIVMSYYIERQSLLKSLRLMLTCQMAEEDASTRYLETISKEVTKLLKDGLEDNILHVLRESLSSVQPRHLDRDNADMWAEEVALEQILLLDILFLLYYEPLSICKFTRLQDLMNIFEDIIIWRSKGEILALTPETENSLRHARRQIVLIIIEALGMESLLLMVQSDTPFSQGGYALSVEDLRQLDVRMAGLDLEQAAECGPVLLSWATFLSLVSFLPLADGQPALVDVDHSMYARQAYEAGAFDYLLDMLRDESFQEFDIQVGGYKSVIKTLMSAFLAAYDFAGQMGFEGRDVLVDILCELYRGQEALCLELWDRDSVIDGPIRNLLFSLRDSFPDQTLSLVRLLAAQCEGTWPAKCVYDFLDNMVEVTCLYQHDERSLTNESGSMVQTTVTLQVPDAPGLLIPARTSGCVLQDFSGGVSLVRWECKHSGIVVLLLRVLQRSVNSYHMEEVLAIVDLINRMLSANKALTQCLLDLDVSPATVAARADGRVESSLRLEIVRIICSVINALVQNTGDDVMIASCIGILTSFSFCCPEEVMTELGQSILQPLGSYLDSSNGRSFPNSRLHELIVKTEQSSGHYPLTIAVLDFIRTMVERGTAPISADSFAFSSLIMHVVGNLFVDHGNWKYKQWHERWMITTKVIWIMRSIVTGIIQTRDVSSFKGVLELLLYDCVVQDVLINVLSVGGKELEELHFNRTVAIKEIEWLQQAIYSVLMLLYDLVLDVTIGICSKEYNGVMLLDQTLFRKLTGSLPVVTAIASFLSFSRNRDLQFASAKAFTSLLLLSQKSRQQPSSIASYISSTDQASAIQKVAVWTAIRELLCEDIAIYNRPLFEAIIDLLTAAVRWQPALVEYLLFPVEQPVGATRTEDRGVTGARSPNGDWSSEGVDALWRLVINSQMIYSSHPHVLSRVLFLLASIWDGGIEYLHVIEALRSRTDFWKQLTSCLSFSNLSTAPPSTILSQIKARLDPETPVLASMRNRDLLAYSFMYTSEASVLSIMARDIFLQQHLVPMGISDSNYTEGSDIGSDKKENGAGNTVDMKRSSKVRPAPAVSGALPILLEWCKGAEMNTIMSSYALCLYDKEILLRAKGEARVLMVGLMGKILSGDIRGLNVSLAIRVRETAREINKHPAFEELSEQYSSRGYSYGEQLQVMLMSDLFHHLQGELVGGRPIPSGSFQHLVEFLVSSEVDRLVNPTVADHIQDLHPSYGDTFMYDTAVLETKLGLEWWGHSDFDNVTASVADSTLRCTRQSNAMASLGHSQLSALRSWSALQTVLIFNKQEARGGLTFSASDWTEAKLTSYSTELSVALEGILTAIGPIGDATNFTPTFLTSQGQLLLVFIRWLSRLDASLSRKLYVWSICAKLVRTVVGCLKKLLDAQCFQHQQIKELVKSFLGALLLLLELMQSQKSQVDDSHKSGEPNDMDIGDLFVDVTLVGLGFLPSLCHAVEKSEYANIAIAVINVLIKSFLAPSTWFPVLQSHFPLAVSLSRMHEDQPGDDLSKAMLNFCLSFVRLKGGAELLYSAGFFSQLQMLSLSENEEVSFSSGETDGPFSVWWKHGRQHGGRWSLSVAVVAGLVRSLGDKDPSGTVLQNAMAYIQLQKDQMVGALRAPTPAMDFKARKKVKLQWPRTTLSALQDTQHVMALMCEVSHHHLLWTLKDSISDFGEMVVHLLAFIAREGLVHPGSSIRSGTGTGFSCQPLQKDELMAHTRPAVINSSCAWFAVTARGCTVGESAPSVRSQSPSRSSSHSLIKSPSRRTSSSSPPLNYLTAGGTGGAQASEYSNMVAIHIYKLSFLLLRYLCQQARLATRRLEEGGPLNYSSFPELPAPEILHGLQDQVVAVVTEICGRVPEQAAQKVCIMLLSVLEMTLHLEICIAKTCNVGPLPLRSDDFGKEYKAMLLAGYPHAFLEPSLQSLTRIMSSAHPGLM